MKSPLSHPPGVLKLPFMKARSFAAGTLSYYIVGWLCYIVFHFILQQILLALRHGSRMEQIVTYNVLSAVDGERIPEILEVSETCKFLSKSCTQDDPENREECEKYEISASRSTVGNGPIVIV